MGKLRRLDVGRLAIVVVLVIGTTAIFTQDQWDWLLESGEPETTGVDAPTVDTEELDAETQRLYRIEPNGGSEARYVVTERLAGERRTTVGTTTVLGGDIVVDTVNPTASTVGEIVVNVEMFTSNSNLRDKRLRHDFLESNHFPFVSFVPSEIVGLPEALVEAVAVPIEITGDLTVKETTLPVTFTGDVTIRAAAGMAELSGSSVSIESLASNVSGQAAGQMMIKSMSDAVKPGGWHINHCYSGWWYDTDGRVIQCNFRGWRGCQNF